MPGFCAAAASPAENAGRWYLDLLLANQAEHLVGGSLQLFTCWHVIRQLGRVTNNELSG